MLRRACVLFLLVGATASCSAPAAAQALDEEVARRCVEEVESLSSAERSNCRRILSNVRDELERVAGRDAAVRANRAVNALLNIRIRASQRDGLLAGLSTAWCLESIDPEEFQPEVEQAQAALAANREQLTQLIGEYRARMGPVYQMVDTGLVTCSAASQSVFNSLVEGSDRSVAAEVVRTFRDHCVEGRVPSSEFRDLTSRPPRRTDDPCAS